MRNFLDQTSTGYCSREQGAGPQKTWRIVFSSFPLQSPGRGKSIHSLQDLPAEHSRTRKQGPCLGQGTQATCLLSRALHQNQPDTCQNAPQHRRRRWWPVCAKPQLCFLQLKERAGAFTERSPCARHSTAHPSMSQPLSWPHKLPPHPTLSCGTSVGTVSGTVKPPLSSLPLSPALGVPAAERPGPSSSLFQFFVIILEALQWSDLAGWDKNPKLACFTRLLSDHKEWVGKALETVPNTKDMLLCSSPSKASYYTSLNIKFLPCFQPTQLTPSSGLPPCFLSSMQTSHLWGHHASSSGSCLLPL